MEVDMTTFAQRPLFLVLRDCDAMIIDPRAPLI